jgi:hypothetical protein
MKLTDEELRLAYQQETGRSAELFGPSTGGASTRGAGTRGQCLAAEMLERAASGNLIPSERNQVADHLSLCADCTDEYRLIQSLKPWAEEVTARVGAAPASVHVQKADSRSSERGLRGLFGSLFSPGLLSYAMAASLIVLALGLGAWVVILLRQNSNLEAGLSEQRRARQQISQELADREQATASTSESLEETRRQVQEMEKRVQEQETQIAELRQPGGQSSRPELNVPIIDLEPGGSARGGSEGSAKTLDIPSGAASFTLILNVTGQPAHKNYALDITSQSGSTVWQGQGLKRSPYNTFTVSLPRRLLPGGRYQIRLYGLTGNQRQLVEEYAVLIHYR